MGKRQYIRAQVNHIKKLSQRVKEITLIPSKPFKFQPAQYIKVRVNQDAKNSSFTLVSSSTNVNELKITIDNHPKSTVGKQLHQINNGDYIEIKGPYGSFMVKSDANSITYFTHNIGITTLPSNLDYLSRQNYKGKIQIINIFTDDFDPIYIDRITSYSEHLQLNHLILDTSKISNKRLQKGKIKKKVLQKYINEEPAIIYVSGHKKPVKKIGKKLRKLTTSDVILEKF